MEIEKKNYLLVTGGAGFIGANYIEYVYEQFGDEFHIVNLDVLTYAGNLDNIDERIRNSGKYSFEKVDIKNLEEVKKVFEKYDIKKVVHFAAESHVCNSISNPLIFIETNITGTFNLLEAARQQWMETYFKFKAGYEDSKFVHISTDEVYGSLGQCGFFTEFTNYLPNSPYSASKAGSDLFVRSYHHTYGLNVVTTHCSNNYGPKQHPEKLIPKTIMSILQGLPITIHGTGENIRDWLYVRDHCIAIHKILENGKTGQIYNIGADTEISNIYIVYKICEQMENILGKENGTFAKQIVFVEDRPGNDRRYAIDSTKVKFEIGWQKEEGFQSGILKTISFYLNKEGIKPIKELPCYLPKLDKFVSTLSQRQ